MTNNTTDASSWEKFVEARSIDGVRLPIAASWTRSTTAPTDAAQLSAQKEFDADDTLTRATRQVLARYENTLSGTTTWVSVADARGVVSYEWSSTPKLRDLLAEMSVSSGVVLDESTVGTNGVGLAIATRSPSIVRGSEHFNSRWHGLVCAATPVSHPITHEPLGAVNITSLLADENQHLRVTLELMVAGIREVLTAGLRTHHQRLLAAHLSVGSAAAGPVMTFDEHSTIMSDTLRAAGLDRIDLWTFVTRAASSSTTEIVLPSGHRVTAIPVDPTDRGAGWSLVFGSEVARSATGRSIRTAAGPLGPIEQAEYDVIRSVLRDVEGNKSEAAERLRISRGTLYERLRRYGIADA